MASGLTRPLLARSFQTRMFSSAVAQKSESQVAVDREPKYALKKMNNGLPMAVIDNNSPVSKIAIVLKSGPRYEKGDMLGISHCLRAAAHLKTARMTQFGITRTMQQIGSDLTVEVNREYTIYKASVTREFVPDVVTIMREITTNQQFRRWEMENMQEDPNTLTLELEALASQPTKLLMEMIHKAAFREGLGNSLYMAPYQIGNFAPSDLQDWVENYYTEGRISLVGVGVDADTMEALGGQFELRESSGSAGNAGGAKFCGGEIRQQTGGDMAHVAVAVSGASSNSKEYMAVEVLKFLMGAGPYIKWSPYSGLLGAAAAKACDAPHAVASMSASYSDAGLVGFTAVAPSSEIDKVTCAAAQAMKTLLTSTISEKDVARGKAQLKFSLLSNFENSDILLNWIGEQALHADQISTPKDVLAVVDSITAADVNAAAKKMSGSKVAIASIGNVENVPYLDDRLSFLTK